MPHQKILELNPTEVILLDQTLEEYLDLSHVMSETNTIRMHPTTREIIMNIKKRLKEENT